MAGGGQECLGSLFPSGVADGLLGFCFFEGGLDGFGEWCVGWGDVGEEVEGLGGVFEVAKVGLGAGQGEEVVGVLVFGDFAEAGGEGKGFLGAADFFVWMGGKNA